MNIIMQNNGEVTMTLKEITDLLGVRHDKAMIKVLKLAEEPSFGTVSKLDIAYNDNGQTIKTLLLTKKQSIAAAARLNNRALMTVVNKLEELSEANKPKMLPQTYKEALLALVAKEEELEEAVRTKAFISDKKTATAMNTASQAVKRANKLEIELDKSKEYCTIKRMEMIYHGQKFNWRLLRSISQEMAIETIDVFDSNYGTVKSYHKDVWLEAYALEF